MSKKPNTAAALAGILNARRSDEPDIESSAPATVSDVPETLAPPPPAPLPSPPPRPERPPISRQTVRIGKSKDTANYNQFSVYLRKDTRKKAGRLLEDTNPEMDFSDLVQELLEKWIASNT